MNTVQNTATVAFADGRIETYYHVHPFVLRTIEYLFSIKSLVAYLVVTVLPADYYQN